MELNETFPGGEMLPPAESQQVDIEELSGGEEMDEWSNQACAEEEEQSELSVDDDAIHIATPNPNQSTDTLPTEDSQATQPLEPSLRVKTEEDADGAEEDSIKWISSSKELSPATFYKCCNCSTEYHLDAIGPVDGDIPLFGDVKARFWCSTCQALRPSRLAAADPSALSSSLIKAVFEFPDKRPWTEIAFVALTNLARQTDKYIVEPEERTFHHFQSTVVQFIYAHFSSLCSGYTRNCWKTHLATAMNTLPSHFEHSEGQQGRGWWRLKLGAQYPTEDDVLLPPRPLPASQSPWRRNSRHLNVDSNDKSLPVVPASARAHRKRTYSEACLSMSSRDESSDSVSTAANEASDSSYGSSSQTSGDTTPRYSVPRHKKSATTRPSLESSQSTDSKHRAAAPSSSTSETSIRPKARRDLSEYLISSLTPKPTQFQEWLEVESRGPFAAQYVRSRLAHLPREKITAKAIRELRMAYDAAASMAELEFLIPTAPTGYESLQALTQQARVEQSALTTSYVGGWLSQPTASFHPTAYQFPSFTAHQAVPPTPSYRFSSHPWTATLAVPQYPLSANLAPSNVPNGLFAFPPHSGPYQPYFR